MFARGKTRALLGGVFAALVLVVTLDTWRAAVTYPWAELNSDNFAIGAMLFRKDDPTLFQRDPIYASEDSYKNYTPSYLFLLDTLTDHLTGGDFLKATALLQAPVLIVFLAVMYWLLWQVTGSIPACLLFSLVAANSMTTLKTFWAAIGLHAMLPRVIALPLVVLAVLVFLRAYSQPATERRWQWPLAGFIVGLMANLHPPSGLTLALTLGGMGMFKLARQGRPQLVNLVMFTGATALGSLPVLFMLGGDVTVKAPVTDFSAYVSRLQIRLIMVPFRTHMGRITSLTPDQQILIGLLWLPLTLYAWLSMKPQKYPWTALPFVLVQLAYMWLMTTPTGIILAIGLFYLWRWRDRAIDRELVWMELAAAVIFAGYFMPIVVRAVWLTLETTTLTSIVVQLPRASKLFALVLFIVGARFFSLLVERWNTLPRTQVWVEFLALLGVVAYSGPAVYFVPLALVYLLREQPDAWRREKPALYAAWVALTAQIAFMIMLGDDTATTLVAGALGVWVWLAHKRSVPVRLGGACVIGLAAVLLLATPLAGGGAQDAADHAGDALAKVLVPGKNIYILFAGTAGSLLFLLSNHRRSISRLTVFLSGALLVVLGLQMLEVTGVIDAVDDAPPPSAPYQLGTWAAAHTDTNALFLYRDRVKSSDSAEFRLWSKRAVWSSYKDLDFVALLWPGKLVEEYDRWLEIMRLDTPQLLTLADAVQLDYLVHPLSDPLPLPLVYRYDEQDIGIYRYSFPPDTLLEGFSVGDDIMLVGWSPSRQAVPACQTFTLDTWWQGNIPPGITYTLGLVQPGDMYPSISPEAAPQHAEPLHLSHVTAAPQEDDLAFALLSLQVPCNLPPSLYTIQLGLRGNITPTVPSFELGAIRITASAGSR